MTEQEFWDHLGTLKGKFEITQKYVEEPQIRLINEEVCPICAVYNKLNNKTSRLNFDFAAREIGLDQEFARQFAIASDRNFKYKDIRTRILQTVDLKELNSD